MNTWQDKAKSIIGKLCRKSYLDAGNKPGKKHKPYSVPEVAQDLIDCLNANDEHTAKSIMMYNYEISCLGDN